MQYIYPEVSVVITVYNKGELFRRSLAAVLKQKFDNYEIIIIDDGSTDNSREIINEFNNHKIRYYYQDHSGLPAVARNKGIKYSYGKYIAFLDGDDIWYPEKIAKCYNIFKQYPNVDLVCHNELGRDISGRVIRYFFYGPYTDDIYRRLLFRANYLSPSATVIKKETLLDVGLFREYSDFFSVEDYDLWIRLSKNHKFYFIQDVLGEWLMNEKNISSDIERHYNNQVAMLKINFQEYNNKKASDFYLFNLRIARIYFIITRYFITKGKIKKAIKYFLKILLQFLANKYER